MHMRVLFQIVAVYLLYALDVFSTYVLYKLTSCACDVNSFVNYALTHNIFLWVFAYFIGLTFVVLLFAYLKRYVSFVYYLLIFVLFIGVMNNFAVIISISTNK